MISVLIGPFLPNTARAMRGQLALPEESAPFADALVWGRFEPATTIALGEPLFPRIETDEQ